MLLSRLAAAKSIETAGFELADELKAFEPDWRKLLLAASILAPTKTSRSVELALSVAHAGLLFSKSPSGDFRPDCIVF
jgi:hypothetical protein